MTRKYAQTWQHHMARYVFALPHCWRKDTLDVGSQMGYGAHLLSYVANSITLTDINQVYLDQAKRYYKFFCPHNLIQADLEKEFPKGEWEAMTCFEVIEHLEDPNTMLAGARDALVEGGKFIFSVPDMIANHEHKQLYDREKIRELVSKYFDLEEFYDQDKNAISDKPLYKDLRCFVGVGVKR